MSSLLQIVFQIVANTPLWVWPLMALVVWLGVLGLRPRVLPLWRLSVLPAVGLILSFLGIGQATQPALALVAWLAALGIALPLGVLLGRLVEPMSRGAGDGHGAHFSIGVEVQLQGHVSGQTLGQRLRRIHRLGRLQERRRPGQLRGGGQQEEEVQQQRAQSSAPTQAVTIAL